MAHREQNILAYSGADESGRSPGLSRAWWYLVVAGISVTVGLGPLFVLLLDGVSRRGLPGTSELMGAAGLGVLGIVLVWPVLYVVGPASLPRPASGRLHRNNAAERAMVYALMPIAWSVRIWDRVRRPFRL